MKQIRKWRLAALLVCVLLTVCACHESPSQDQLYRKLFTYFENQGFTCELYPVEEERSVPIYRPTAWQSLMLNGDEVLVYFDDSNRADYLSTFVDEETFGPAWRFGLRFVLVYDGDQQAVLDALNEIENV